MEKDKTKQIQEILTQWNPLGKRAKMIPDLNNYETEAEDIIFNIEMEVEMLSRPNLKKITQKVVRQVINEAFNMHLTAIDCENASGLIYNVLK